MMANNEKTPRFKPWAPGFACGLAMLLCGTAMAQSGMIEEVVVTAQKRAQAVTEVPIAIQALSGDSLREQGVNSFEDLRNVATSVNLTRGLFGLDLNIRGVTTTDPIIKAQQGIGFTVDGVPIARQSARAVALFDLARVEVLRGPQGTLYGASTTGGQINVVTNRPNPEKFTVAGQFELGNFGSRRFEGHVNVPLGDRFAFRAAGVRNKRDPTLRSPSGMTERGDADDWTARFALEGDITDDLVGRVTVTTGEQKGIGPGLVPNGTLLNNEGDAQRVLPENPMPVGLDNDFINVEWEFNWYIGPATVTYIGSRQEYNSDERRSLTRAITGNLFWTEQGIPIPDPALAALYGLTGVQPSFQWALWEIEDRTDTHEFRITNTEPATLDYIFGVNYLDEPIDEIYHRFNAPVGDPTNFALSATQINPWNNTTNESLGVYGQGEYHLNDRLGIFAGLRWSDDEVTRRGTFAAPDTPCPLGLAPCGAAQGAGPNNGEQSASKVTWRVGANYDIGDSSALYAYVATGYKPGGFNDFDPESGDAAAPYDPENLTAYEIGYKGQPWERIKFESTAFYYDYEETQLTSYFFLGGSPIYLTRIIPTEIYGWENDLTAYVADNTRLRVTATFTESEITGDFYTSKPSPAFGPNVNLKGRSLDSVADFVGTLELVHEVLLPNGGWITFRAFTKYSSGYGLLDLSYGEGIEQGSFTRSDASIRYASPDETYFVELFVQNIENELQATGSQELNGGYLLLGDENAAGTFASTPRFTGIRVGAEF